MGPPPSTFQHFPAATPPGLTPWGLGAAAGPLPAAEVPGGRPLPPQPHRAPLGPRCGPRGEAGPPARGPWSPQAAPQHKSHSQLWGGGAGCGGLGPAPPPLRVLDVLSHGRAVVFCSAITQKYLHRHLMRRYPRFVQHQRNVVEYFTEGAKALVTERAAPFVSSNQTSF